MNGSGLRLAIFHGTKLLLQTLLAASCCTCSLVIYSQRTFCDLLFCCCSYGIVMGCRCKNIIFNFSPSQVSLQLRTLMLMSNQASCIGKTKMTISTFQKHVKHMSTLANKVCKKRSWDIYPATLNIIIIYETFPVLFFIGTILLLRVSRMIIARHHHPATHKVYK